MRIALAGLEADVTGELLAEPNDKFTLGGGGPKLYTPWRAFGEAR